MQWVRRWPRLSDCVRTLSPRRSQVESLRIDLSQTRFVMLQWCVTTRSTTWADACRSPRRMLDDAGDGLVISSINARTETRTYAKGVKAGASDAILSPEEEQAIGYAQRGVGSAQ